MMASLFRVVGGVGLVLWVVVIILLYAAIAAAALDLLFGWNTVMPVATVLEKAGATMRSARDGILDLSRRFGKRVD